MEFFPEDQKEEERQHQQAVESANMSNTHGSQGRKKTYLVVAPLYASGSRQGT
jgi:hypothetical protein